MISQSLNITETRPFSDCHLEEICELRPSEDEQRFSETLEKCFAPFAKWINCSLGYFSGDGKLKNIIGAKCGCDNICGLEKTTRNQHVEQKIFYAGENLGTVVLCCLPNLVNADEFLEQIVELAFEDLISQEDENALLAELALSWESLQAVYDLNADLNAFHNPQKLLEKITERATAIGNEIFAVLWIDDGENLTPAASKNFVGLKPRRKNCGLVGDVFSNKRAVICNDRANLQIVAASEIELKNAVRIAAFPVATGIKNYGVLEIWQETENAVFDSRTTRLLDTLALQAAMVIETERLHRESIENEKLQQEIEIGSKIQQILLTGNPPEGIRGVKFSALTIPSRQIDGDFYDFIEHGEDCFDLIIGDVMGKGIPAALVGAATKNCFLRAVGQLQSIEQISRPAPEKIVGWVNSEVTAKLMQFESFVTACYARFDLEKKLVTFVDCGHTKTIFYSRKTGEISALEGDNMPLGFSEREIFSEQIIKIAAGDVLFFFSDGITEARDQSGEFFGDERLAEFVRQNAANEPKKMISDLLETLQNFSGEKNFGDDLTCVAVRIESKSGTIACGEIRLSLDSDLRELAQAREFVRRITNLSNESVSAEFVDQLELAVNEAVTNIVLHAFHNKTGNQIEISAEICRNGLHFTLAYDGEEFDPNHAAPPIFDGSREGGFGLFIISNCVDRVAYSHDSNNRNTICLFKKFKD